MQITFKNKKVNIRKLLSFGFAEQKQSYLYSAPLADGLMTMNIIVYDDGAVSTEVIDNSNGEEYVLHQVQGAAGAFVGQIRGEYEAVLERISAQCFDTEVFKSEYARRLIAYVQRTYGDDPEFLWERFPDNAVWRRKDNRKWYGVLLTVSRRKLGLDSDALTEIIDLRIKPEELEKLVDCTLYFPGYHMNKRHWLTIVLDGSVPFDEICERLEESHRLALKKS